MTNTPEPSIFTRIINREIPADIVYEDDLVIAFFTIEPINPGHTLIVPKIPFVNVLDGDSTTLGHMMKVAQKISLALVENKIATGINLIMNNEIDGGQEVFHAHLHVVPRTKEDKVFSKPQHTKTTAEEMSRTAAILKNYLI